MVQATSELANFILDLEDEECPRFGLHLAAYQGDLPGLRSLLDDPEAKRDINARIRPFLATPLRLAATGRTICCRSDNNQAYREIQCMLATLVVLLTVSVCFFSCLTFSLPRLTSVKRLKMDF